MSLARYSALIGGDWGVYQTVSAIKGLINHSLVDPQARIRLRAESLLAYAPERDDVAEVESIFNFVQNALHYIDDPVEIELVKSPLLIDQAISDSGYFMGDCDDASAYLAALLKSVGYQTELVVVAPQGADTYDYRHIFVRVWLPRSQEWVSLDATAKGKPYGWEVPNIKERAFTV